MILSIENHCSIQQQKKIAQYLREIFADKLDIGDVLSGNCKTLPSPHSLQGKILIKVRINLKWLDEMNECLTEFKYDLSVSALVNECNCISSPLTSVKKEVCMCQFYFMCMSSEGTARPLIISHKHMK